VRLLKATGELLLNLSILLKHLRFH